MNTTRYLKFVWQFSNIMHESFKQFRTNVPFYFSAGQYSAVLATYRNRCMFLSCHVRISEWIHTPWFPVCQETPCSKQARNLKFKWLQLDSNHNHLVRKRLLNHLAKQASLAKWLSVRLRTKWLWVRVQLQSLKYRNQSVRLLNKSIAWFLYHGNTAEYWKNLK